MKTKTVLSHPAPKTKTLFKALAIALVMQALTTSARSAVSMKDAAFLTTAKDITLRGAEGPPLAFKRYYSSRSHYLGWFGFGWCSDFEKKIEFLEKGKIRLTDCKMSKPEDLTTADYQRLPDRIKIITRSDNSRAAPPTNPLILAKAEIPNLARLPNALDDNETTTEFDLRGRLIKISGPEINTTITYLNNTAKIAGQLTLTFDPATKLVKSMSSADGQKMTYEYDGDNLVAVKDAKTYAFQYKYDEFQNIERIDYQDKSFETVSYDSQQDRVKLLRDRKGCIEKYSFEKYIATERTEASVAKPETPTAILPRSQISGYSKVERLCQGRLVAHALFRIGSPAATKYQPKIERLPSNANQGELQ